MDQTVSDTIKLSNTLVLNNKR